MHVSAHRFKVEALCAIHCGCQHTSTSNRKPSDSEWKSSVLYSVGVTSVGSSKRKPSFSEWKPCVLYIVSDSTPILQRGNFMHCTLWVPAHLILQRGNLMYCTLWVSAHPYFREETLCAICGVCEHTHASERKPYMLYVVGVSTLTSLLFRKQCCFLIICSGCYTNHVISEFRSCVKVEVAVLGSPS